MSAYVTCARPALVERPRAHHSRRRVRVCARDARREGYAAHLGLARRSLARRRRQNLAQLARHLVRKASAHRHQRPARRARDRGIVHRQSLAQPRARRLRRRPRERVRARAFNHPSRERARRPSHARVGRIKSERQSTVRGRRRRERIRPDARQRQFFHQCEHPPGVFIHLPLDRAREFIEHRGPRPSRENLCARLLARRSRNVARVAREGPQMLHHGVSL